MNFLYEHQAITWIACVRG